MPRPAPPLKCRKCWTSSAAVTPPWSLIYTVYEMNSDEARDTVRSLRAYDAEGDYLVSGATASLMDAVEAMYDAFPWALALITVSVYLVLTFLFRSCGDTSEGACDERDECLCQLRRPGLHLPAG